MQPFGNPGDGPLVLEAEQPGGELVCLANLDRM
jgi:hypothetical protein